MFNGGQDPTRRVEASDVVVCVVHGEAILSTIGAVGKSCGGHFEFCSLCRLHATISFTAIEKVKEIGMNWRSGQLASVKTMGLFLLTSDRYTKGIWESLWIKITFHEKKATWIASG